MSTDPVKLILFIGLLLLLAGSVMGQPAQSHPLSQILPIDTNLDMSENSVQNISELILDEGTEPEGLVFDDLTITHEGRAQKLVLDYNNNEWRIEDSDLNLNGNNISGFFGSDCSTGEFAVDIENNGNIRCLSPTTELDSVYVKRAGDYMNGTLGMAGYSLLGLNQIQTNGTGITISDSNGNNLFEIQESGATDLRANNLEGVRKLIFVDSAYTDQYTAVYDEGNGYFRITNSGEDVLRIDDSTNNLILPGGGLDMQNSNINNFFGSACAQGDVMVQVNSDGSFECVDATNEVQDDFVSRTGDTMTGALDMQGNNILFPGEVNGVNLTDPGNAITINGNQYGVAPDSIAVTELDEGSVDDRYVQLSGDVMNGTLDMDGNLLMNFFGSACPSGQVVTNVNNDGTYDCVEVANEVQSTYVNRAGDTMNGTLDMLGNNINNVSTVNSNGVTLNTGGDIASGGDIVSGTGTVTSTSEMCIGDQCS